MLFLQSQKTKRGPRDPQMNIAINLTVFHFFFLLFLLLPLFEIIHFNYFFLGNKLYSCIEVFPTYRSYIHSYHISGHKTPFFNTFAVKIEARKK